MIVIAVDKSTNPIRLLVAFGTSKHTDKLGNGEFCINENENPIEWKASGLAKTTKFSLAKRTWLKFDTDWFQAQKGALTPRRGSLNPTLYSIFESSKNDVEDAEGRPIHETEKQMPKQIRRIRKISSRDAKADTSDRAEK